MWQPMRCREGVPANSRAFRPELLRTFVERVRRTSCYCGYGVAQVTSGMARTDTTTYTAEQQKAITVDYAANIAAGLQILQDKWNQLYDKGMLVNGGDPQYLENWWLALWAYNSGFNAPSASDTAAPWGLGWFNNPANGLYPADRKMFLSSGYEDARTPNLWTYPERVLGWAAYSLQKTDPATGTTGKAFTVGTWPTGNAPDAQPAHDTFCKPASNECDTSKPRKVEGSSQPEGPCQRDDFKCWWHEPATWTDCATTCGTEVLKYQAGEREPQVTPVHPASCTSTLPANALIVDDVPDTVKFRTSSTNPCAGKHELDQPGHAEVHLRVGSAERRDRLPLEDRLPSARCGLRRPLLVHPHPGAEFHRLGRHRHLDARSVAHGLGPDHGPSARPRGQHRPGDVPRRPR